MIETSFPSARQESHPAPRSATVSGGGLFAARLRRSVRASVIDWVHRLTGTQKFLSLQIDITNACNLACAHCYHAHHSNRGALEIADWRHILDQYERLLETLHLRPWINLCGGEPTLSPLLPQMLDEIATRWPGVHIGMMTNGTMLSQNLVTKLGQLGVRAQISLDGPDARRHDSIRGSGTFDQAVEGLRKLKQANLEPFFQATLTKRTSAWIPDFFQTAAAYGAARMNFTRFVVEGAGAALVESGRDAALSGDALRKAFLRILAASRRSGIPTDTNQPLFTLLDSALGANGKVGFQGLVIDYQGNLKVTSRAGYKLGNVLDEGLENLFLRHPIMTSLRDRDIEGCGACPHYAKCGGDRNASFAATGSFLKKDPGCWL